MDELSVNDAIALMQSTADALPGAFGAEIGLVYHAGGGPEPWACDVEGDLLGDDGGMFRIWGATPQEAIQRAVAEAWRRVP